MQNKYKIQFEYNLYKTNVASIAHIQVYAITQVI